jgi:hypothetical protein
VAGPATPNARDDTLRACAYVMSMHRKLGNQVDDGNPGYRAIR